MQKYGPDVVAKLKRSRYGLQDANRKWQGNYTTLVAAHGHRRGQSNGTILRNAEADCRACVMMTISACCETNEIEDPLPILSYKYAYTRLAILRFECEDDRNALFLNRLQIVDKPSTPNTINNEPDARHARMMMRYEELENAMGTETLAERR